MPIHTQIPSIFPFAVHMLICTSTLTSSYAVICTSISANFPVSMLLSISPVRHDPVQNLHCHIVFCFRRAKTRPLDIPPVCHRLPFPCMYKFLLSTFYNVRIFCFSCFLLAAKCSIRPYLFSSTFYVLPVVSLLWYILIV
jgi:hypothetical protein